MAETLPSFNPELRLRESVADGTLKLPVLPAVAANVLAMSQSEDSDAARLAALIQKDPALASNVLRIVNTAAFRGAAEIVALQQAIARLGMARIREIALSLRYSRSKCLGGRPGNRAVGSRDCPGLPQKRRERLSVRTAP